MLTATRIRLYPNATQRLSLARQFGCSRWVWNEALAEMQRVYQATGKGLTYEALCRRLPALKRENEWLSDAVAQALQQSLRNLTRAFSNFFAKRARYPRHKSRHGRQSVQFPQGTRLADAGIILPKLGKVSAVLHREIVGTIKTVTVTMEPCGHYYAAVLAEDGVADPIVTMPDRDGVLGIDVGLLDFAVTSAGSHFNNPRHLMQGERNLKRKQRKLARKRKGSNSRAKARRLVARVHERVSNARKDFLHKLSRRLVDENQAISVENLSVKGMVRNPNLAKAISDAGWSMFTRMLEYKAARAGKSFVCVDRFFPSTKACSVCGTIRDSIPLSQRRWSCDHCGSVHDRDENAAKNIAAEGWRVLASGTGAAAVRGAVSHR